MNKRLDRQAVVGAANHLLRGMPETRCGQVVLGDKRVVAADQLPVRMAVESESRRRRCRPIGRQGSRVERLGDRAELLEIALQLLRIFGCTNRNQLLTVDTEIDLVPCLAKGSDRIKHGGGEGRSGISSVSSPYLIARIHLNLGQLDAVASVVCGHKQIGEG